MTDGSGGRPTRGGRRLAPLLLVALASLFASFLVGCGEADDGAGSAPTSDTGATVGPAPLLTVEEALADTALLESPVAVWGSLYVDESGPRLCSALLESYPPQCGEPSLALEGLDLETVVALEQAGGQGQDDSAPADYPRWTSYQFAVVGTLGEDGETFAVEESPPVGAAEEGAVSVRFSYSPFPLRPGPVAWALEVENAGDQPLELTFPTGQRIEVVLLALDGEEVYRWSGGQAFTQAFETVTVAPGRTLPLARTGSLEAVPPGDGYRVEASVTAEESLPAVTMDAQPIISIGE